MIDTMTSLGCESLEDLQSLPEENDELMRDLRLREK